LYMTFSLLPNDVRSDSKASVAGPSFRVESGNDSYFNIIPPILQKRTRIFEFKDRRGSVLMTPMLKSRRTSLINPFQVFGALGDLERSPL
jgi:hypothetical protein